METFFACGFGFAALILPFILLKLRWPDWIISFIVGGILNIVAILSGEVPEPAIILLRFSFGTLVTGSFYWGIITISRRIYVKFTRTKTQESKTDSEYIVCTRCGLEQWKGYQQCQKCGAVFNDARK